MLLSPAETGLDRESVALVCQVMTLDKDYLDGLVGSLTLRARRRIDLGLALTLGLR